MTKPIEVCDIEVYKNYFLVLFQNVEHGTKTAFELYDGVELDKVGLERKLKVSQIVTFNGRNYDVNLIFLAISGATNAKLKEASDRIIKGGMKFWEFERYYGIKIPRWLDHIDLIEVAPGKASLKAYGGRLHSKKIQDLPIEPDATISPDQRLALKLYCGNDLQTTIDLMTYLKPQIELRERMTNKVNIDLRSKSDAQIAEAVIKRQVETRIGSNVIKPPSQVGEQFFYTPPQFVFFRTETLTQVFNKIVSSPFVVSEEGAVGLPEWLADEKIEIGGSVYRMGIGGLHSSETTVAHIADEHTLIIDRDVASYYPSIILELGLYPAQMGVPFLHVYRGIVRSRLDAKARGDKVTADALKITINGSYGKLGSKYSYLYSPSLLIQTTITGQLCLLMLIEILELNGIPVVSANTDGVVIKCPKSQYETLNTLIYLWEWQTGFATEETRYTAVYSRDVNNYLAIKPNGDVKAKGAYAHAGLQKNPSNEICIDAVIAYLKEGTDPLLTIMLCDDVRKFVTVRACTGGAEKNGVALGKAVRWYYAVGETGTINYIKKRKNGEDGNIVARSQGAKPLMELPDELPNDIDYDWYIKETYDLLEDIGAIPRKPVEKKKRARKNA